MKKILLVFGLFMLITNFAFADGTVIKTKPEDFKDKIIVNNQTGKEINVYLYILYEGNTEDKYKSRVIHIKQYEKKKIGFDYDDYWHDLVKDVCKFYHIKEKKASSYDFEFHFSEEGILLDKAKVVEHSYELTITDGNAW